ncbi:MAG: SprT family zinc-dependent metalloprotease [Sulfuricellaceae bacterium]|nr:SprT family zinc-dependent metalloprotease [Sulfuricellaceae bacterium]
MNMDQARSHRIRLGNEEILCLVRQSARRRSIAVRVDEKGLTVTIPARLRQAEWESVLQSKSGWILDKLGALRARPMPVALWQDGQPLPYLGSAIELQLTPGTPRPTPRLLDGQLHIGLSSPLTTDVIEKRVVHWYRQQALLFFQQRIAALQRQLDVVANSVSLSSARTRWGSCTSRGDIRLNWRLIKAPPSIIDYVICHELSHLVELNHSPAFWQVVGSLCPDYLALRKALKIAGASYYDF